MLGRFLERKGLGTIARVRLGAGQRTGEFVQCQEGFRGYRDEVCEALGFLECRRGQGENSPEQRDSARRRWYSVGNGRRDLMGRTMEEGEDQQENRLRVQGEFDGQR